MFIQAGGPEDEENKGSDLEDLLEELYSPSDDSSNDDDD